MKLLGTAPRNARYLRLSLTKEMGFHLSLNTSKGLALPSVQGAIMGKNVSPVKQSAKPAHFILMQFMQ